MVGFDEPVAERRPEIKRRKRRDESEFREGARNSRRTDFVLVGIPCDEVTFLEGVGGVAVAKVALINKSISAKVANIPQK